MQINIIIGLILSVFGLSLILFKGAWRTMAKGFGSAHAKHNNFFMKLYHLDKKIKYTGVDEKYTASDKGLIIVGMFFFIFGLIVLFLPYIYSYLS